MISWNAHSSHMHVRPQGCRTRESYARVFSLRWTSVALSIGMVASSIVNIHIIQAMRDTSPWGPLNALLVMSTPLGSHLCGKQQTIPPLRGCTVAAHGNEIRWNK